MSDLVVDLVTPDGLTLTGTALPAEHSVGEALRALAGGLSLPGEVSRYSLCMELDPLAGLGDVVRRGATLRIVRNGRAGCICIDLVTPEGTTLEQTEIPLENTVEQILSEVSGSLQLDLTSLCLYSEHHGAVLSRGLTLHDAGVQPGQRLRLLRGRPGELPGPGETCMTVLLVNPAMARRELKVVNPESATAGLVSALIRNGRATGEEADAPEGAWLIGSKARGRALLPSETLRSAGVPQLDTLTVFRSVIGRDGA